MSKGVHKHDSNVIGNLNKYFIHLQLRRSIIEREKEQILYLDIRSFFGESIIGICIQELNFFLLIVNVELQTKTAGPHKCVREYLKCKASK